MTNQLKSESERERVILILTLVIDRMIAEMRLRLREITRSLESLVRYGEHDSTVKREKLYMFIAWTAASYVYSCSFTQEIAHTIHTAVC